ncbi:hypothetical protein M5K25_019299 [Dendrobium thyrsiflorum]|uniref:Uncharacterized protein n=1 Tax=Dendrobium thyrsiflorum TaxID=117978 RepID=A0ABD0UEQ4_DENTH
MDDSDTVVESTPFDENVQVVVNDPEPESVTEDIMNLNLDESVVEAGNVSVA